MLDALDFLLQQLDLHGLLVTVRVDFQSLLHFFLQFLPFFFKLIDVVLLVLVLLVFDILQLSGLLFEHEDLFFVLLPVVLEHLFEVLVLVLVLHDLFFELLYDGRVLLLQVAHLPVTPFLNPSFVRLVSRLLRGLLPVTQRRVQKLGGLVRDGWLLLGGEILGAALPLHGVNLLLFVA